MKVTGQDLLNEARYKVDSATGDDSWSVGELKVPPIWYFEVLATIFGDIMDGQPWPDLLTQATVYSMPKEEDSSKVKDLRLLTVSLASCIGCGVGLWQRDFSGGSQPLLPRDSVVVSKIMKLLKFPSLSFCALSMLMSTTPLPLVRRLTC